MVNVTRSTIYEVNFSSHCSFSFKTTQKFFSVLQNYEERILFVRSSRYFLTIIKRSLVPRL